jgi:hypothetical protein
VLTLRRSHTSTPFARLRAREWPPIPIGTLLEGIALGLVLSALLAVAIGR